MAVLTQEIKQAWVSWLQEANAAMGSELSCGLTAQDWLNEGLSPSERISCLAVGAFSPECCVELLASGVDLGEIGRWPTDNEVEKYNIPHSGYSLAYMYCNGDLSLSDLQEMIGCH